MITFITKNWTYIVAGGAVIAYAIDKFHAFWSDKKKKQQAYNRTFVAIVKFFYSYEKHKSFYEETPTFNLPNDVYVLLSKSIDSFETDMNIFKESILRESEIIPEISIESHLLFELADRIAIMDRLSSIKTEVIEEITSDKLLMAKRAQFYSTKEIFDDFFKNIIEEVHKHTNVNKNFLKKLQYYRTDEYQTDDFNVRRELFKKYLESLHRQGALSSEEYEQIFNDLIRKNYN